MEAKVLPTSAKMTIDINDVSVVNDLKRLLKHIQGVGKITVCKSYYDSADFYNDIDKAEADIAHGKGKIISTSQELEALFV